MSENNFAVVVLAAGRGIRMKSDVPKVLHQVGGRAMLRLVLDAVEPLQPDRIVVVVGSNMPAVEEMAAPHISVVQDPPLGTGHAVLQAASVLDGYHGVTGHGEVLVVFGDTPLLSTETLETMREARREGEGAPSLVGLGFRPQNARSTCATAACCLPMRRSCSHCLVVAVRTMPRARSI
jgi:bifunctional UDP-N-acetylglucosamine pyrophosphorylase/glucosamine-1-phosphate N-acetyltransferase